MFENILGQDEAVERLSRDIKNSELPGSLLFEGPSLSAKLTCALELARVNSCDKKAPWNCSCPQCSRHRLLSHPDLMLIGPKDTREELRIACDMLQRVPGVPSRYFFIRSVKKLTRRFDAELYGGEESKLNKALPLVRTLIEGIDACMPDRGNDADTAKEALKLLPSCEKLYELVPSATPVFQVRSMEYHARMAPWSKHRTIIIEHADRMLDSSRNALLKILEEPPRQATFILTSSRRQALIPTVLSRVRGYRFTARSKAAGAMVLDRIFRTPAGEYSTLQDFFARNRSSDSMDMDARALDFLSAMLAEMLEKGAIEPEPPLKALAKSSSRGAKAALAAIATETSGFGSSDEASAWTFPAFLEACMRTLNGMLRDPGASLQTTRLAEKFADLTRDALMRYTSYNINPGALAERILQAMLEYAV